LKNCGESYSARSYFRQAFDCYREASHLFRKAGQLKLLNECQDAIGNLTLDFGQTRGAIAQYKRSLIVKNTLKDVPGIVATAMKIAKAYLSLTQYDSALYFNKEVQRLAENNSNTLTDAAIDEFIILSFQRKPIEATEAKAAAERLVKEQNNSALTMQLLVATSNYYLAQKDKEKADKYFDSAATLTQQAKSAELAITGLSMLAEMSRQNDDYKTAYSMGDCPIVRWQFEGDAPLSVSCYAAKRSCVSPEQCAASRAAINTDMDLYPRTFLKRFPASNNAVAVHR
jgi:tetratricopeptide (TPR) repeat protein